MTTQHVPYLPLNLTSSFLSLDTHTLHSNTHTHTHTHTPLPQCTPLPVPWWFSIAAELLLLHTGAPLEVVHSSIPFTLSAETTGRTLLPSSFPQSVQACHRFSRSLSLSLSLSVSLTLSTRLSFSQSVSIFHSSSVSAPYTDTHTDTHALSLSLS